MGLYSIPCRQCNKNFMWFSGNHMDQRCADCKAKDTIIWETGDKNFDTANTDLTITTTHNQADPNWMGLTEEDDK